MELIATPQNLKFYILKNDYISNRIKEYGYFSPTEVLFLKRFINKNDNVVEIGANIGSHTVHLAKCNPQGKYFTFEPQNDIFKLLVTNCVLNGCDNVVAYPYGIGEKDSLIWYNNQVIKDYELNRGAFVIPDPEESTNDNFLKIRSIEYFDELYKLNSIKLIKIDVETHEVMVLKNLQKLIEKYQPIILVEFSIRTFYDVVTTLKKYNYKVYYFITTQSQYNQINEIEDETLQSNDVNVVGFPENHGNIPNYLIEVKDEFFFRRDVFVTLNMVKNENLPKI